MVETLVIDGLGWIAQLFTLPSNTSVNALGANFISGIRTHLQHKKLVNHSLRGRGKQIFQATFSTNKRTT